MGRTGAVLGVLALAFWALDALASDWEDPWVKADREEFDRLHREILAVKEPVWTSEANRLRRAFETGGWTEAKRAAVEVHGVALMRGDREKKPADPVLKGKAKRGPTRATVHVTRTGCDVVLVLCGFESIDWRVTKARGVRLKKVLLYGRGQQRVRGVELKRVQHRTRHFVLNRREDAFGQFASRILPDVPGGTIHTYVGRVDPEGNVLNVGKEDPAWRRQMLIRAISALEIRATRKRREKQMRSANGQVFPMIIWENGRRRYCDATPAGFIADTFALTPGSAFSVAVDPDSGRRYFLDHLKIQEQNGSGRRLGTIKLPFWLGRPGWAADMVHDGRRNRLVVVTMSGVMGAFDLRTRDWEPLGATPTRGGRMAAQFNWSRDGILTALAWDTPRDCFWALHASGRRLRIRRYTAHGTATAPLTFKLPVAVQAGPRNGVVMRVVNGNLAIFTVGWQARRRRVTDKCFVINPKSGHIVHRFTMRSFPALPRPQPNDLPQLWRELGGPDCYSAVQRLSRGDGRVVDYLASEWAKFPTIADDEFNEALRALDSPEADVRADAFARLAIGGAPMRSRFEAAIEREESPEVRMALRRLVDELDRAPNLTGRMSRVLEAIGSAQATALRKKLGKP
ncbi:MAG: hypothetical protein ACYTGZ_15630 [Planctomycetota bacterium]